MASVLFGKESADMRLAEDFYGIVELRDADAFLFDFVPVGDEVLEDSATRLSVRLFDATGQSVTFTIEGMFESGQVSSIVMEAAGLRQGVYGNFVADDFGNVSGTVERFTSVRLSDGAVIVDFANLGMAVSDAMEQPDVFLDESLLAGADSIAAGSGKDFILGYGGNDTLSSGAGDDTLDGGSGADWMYGGPGDDTFHVDTQSDLVFENAGEGSDTVIATTNFYLYAGIEKLTLASGSGDLFGVGNELANTLTGNEGVNLLIGWDGADTIAGGAGNDVVYGVNGNDSLLGEAGIDVLIAGEGADTLDGGADADLLIGEAGNDVLYGGAGFATDILVGGAGNDTLDGSAPVGQTRNEGDYDLMYGGTGDDTYYVDTPADLTFEMPVDDADGTDAVIADITGAGYYLYGGVEQLTLVGNTPFGVGNALDNTLTGSAQTNWLLGGAGNDTLNGKAGNDVLFGEDGSDTFVFERGTGGDVIGDFTPGTDKIQMIGIGYLSFDEVKQHMVESPEMLAIDLGAGDFVVLHNVTVASLSQADFIFG